jgi:hypothetical protein
MEYIAFRQICQIFENPNEIALLSISELHKIYHDFKEEINRNISNCSNLLEAFKYLREIQLDIKEFDLVYKVSESPLFSFSILNGISSDTAQSKRNLFQYGIEVALLLINDRIELVKYLIKHNHKFCHTDKEKSKQSEYKWVASSTDLIELITALTEYGAVKKRTGEPVTYTELEKLLGKAFDIELKHSDTVRARAKHRKKDPSPFLTKLKNVFENYVLMSYK